MGEFLYFILCSACCGVCVETVLQLPVGAGGRTYCMPDYMGKTRQNKISGVSECVSFEIPLGGSAVID